jgi:predicted Co/Zn/Cd cation transporter (cation efflux family)
MLNLVFVWTWFSRAVDRMRDSDSERGDVPGWVMVTVMSAILVVAIIGVFEPQIKDAIGNAIDSVTSSK